MESSVQVNGILSNITIILAESYASSTGHSAGHHVSIEYRSDLRIHSRTDDFVSDFVRAQSHTFVAKETRLNILFYYRNMIQTKNITFYIFL